MKNCLFIASLLFATAITAQHPLKLGAFYTLGASTFYGQTESNAAPKSPVYAPKLALGLGAMVHYQLKERFGMTLFSGYQQRGAAFDRDVYPSPPKYTFNYLDAGWGVFYQTKASTGATQWIEQIAGTFHWLINAQRRNTYEAIQLMNDTKKTDFGAMASVGVLIPRHGTDRYLISLFAHSGFQNVFGGVLADNGQSGKNFIAGLKLGYLIGFKDQASAD